MFLATWTTLHALPWSLAHSRYQVEKGLTGPWSGSAVQENVSSGSSVIMDPGETFALLEAHGLPVAAYAIADSGREAAGAAEGLGYPVVVKVASPNLLHKDGSRGGRPRPEGRACSERSDKPHEGGALSRPEDGPARLRGDRGGEGDGMHDCGCEDRGGRRANTAVIRLSPLPCDAGGDYGGAATIRDACRFGSRCNRLFSQLYSHKERRVSKKEVLNGPIAVDG